MDIKQYYKACEGIILNDTEATIQKMENSGLWVAENKCDGIWFIIFENSKLGFSRRNNTREHHLPLIGNGNIIVGEYGASTEMAIERKNKLGHEYMDVFDIIQYKGKDIRNLPLLERKAILYEWWKEMNIKNPNYYFYIKSYRKNFLDLYKKADEGIVLKRINGIYNPYDYDWVKVKKEYTWDFVIMDYILSDAESKINVPTAKSFIVGQYVNNKLITMSKAPIDISLGMDVAKNFKSYYGKVVEVKGFSRTKRGSVRSPQFVGFRDDKSPENCIFTNPLKI